MRKRLLQIAALSLCLLLFGCSSQTDHLKYLQASPSQPNQEQMTYEVNLGNKVKGASVVAELWQDGKCAKSSSIPLSGRTKKLDITIAHNTHDTGRQDVSVTLRNGTSSGELISIYDLPKNIISYGFTAYEHQEVIEIDTEEERILGAMVFDTGEGVKMINCNSLIEEPERLEAYPCILVIRSTFTETAPDSKPLAAEGMEAMIGAMSTYLLKAWISLS